MAKNILASSRNSCFKVWPIFSFSFVGIAVGSAVFKLAQGCLFNFFKADTIFKLFSI